MNEEGYFLKEHPSLVKKIVQLKSHVYKEALDFVETKDIHETQIDKQKVNDTLSKCSDEGYGKLMKHFIKKELGLK